MADQKPPASADPQAPKNAKPELTEAQLKDVAGGAVDMFRGADRAEPIYMNKANTQVQTPTVNPVAKP